MLRKRYIWGLIIVGGLTFIKIENLTRPQIELDTCSVNEIKINKKGETYGTYVIDEDGKNIEPDLMAVVGLNNVKGYVKKSDLYNEKNQPQNPEEALAMQYKESIRRWNLFYKNTINVYSNDGETILGKYKIN